MTRDIVIVGAGQAGVQAAAVLAQARDQADDAVTVTLVGDEAHPPYQRPPLSKAFLKGDARIEDLYHRATDFYETAGIRLVEARVERIDRDARRVVLPDGSVLAYDHLILATGARNRALDLPGIDLGGIHALRTLDEAVEIAEGLGAARDIVVIGAGFIGLEFAATAVGPGRRIHVVEMADRAMARAVSAGMAAVVEARHRAAGIGFLFGRRATAFEGDAGRVTHVTLDDGRRLRADMVVIGAGIRPNDGLAAAAGLDVADGILVDRDLLTGDPAISAIGDCARFPGEGGGTTRLECVQNAVDQARHVAARLSGRTGAYASVPWFWTDQAEMKLQIAGIGEGADETVTLSDGAAGGVTVMLFRDARLVAVEALNRTADFMAARQILSRDARPGPAEARAPGFDLRAWAKAARAPARPAGTDMERS